MSTAWDIGENVAQNPESSAATGDKQFFYGGNPNAPKGINQPLLIVASVAIVAVIAVAFIGKKSR